MHSRMARCLGPDPHLYAVAHESLAYIVPKPHHNGLIRRIFPQRIAATYGRHMKKVVGRRRRRHRPFQPSVSPWIVSRDFTHSHATENIRKEYQQPGGHENYPSGCEYVQSLPMHVRAVGVNTTGMPRNPRKCSVKNVILKPMKKSQKCHVPNVVLAIRPVIFGNQK